MAKATEKNHTFDHILNVFAWLSFFVAVILAIMVFFSSFSGTSNGKVIFGHQLLIVQSDSMTKPPTGEEDSISFTTGDLIIIKEVKDMSTIKVGNVITFVSYNSDSKGKTVSHKVRSIVKDESGNILGFETYGIYTGTSDEVIVDPNTIIGVYVTKSPFLGKIFNFFKTPAGYFTSILVPCVLLIIFFSIKVGIIISRKDILKNYQREINGLKNQLLELEKNKNGVFMKTDLQEMAIAPDKVAEQVKETISQEQSTGNANCSFAQPGYMAQQPMFSVPPQSIVQIPTYNDKALELTAKALTNTIETLTHTIEVLAQSVGKPVETLARSVETLATATAKPAVIEKVIEKPVIQTVIKEVPVETKKEEIKVEPVRQIIEESVLVEEPISVEELEPTAVESEMVVAFDHQPVEVVAGSMFDEFKQREKIPFNKKLLSLTNDIKEYFSDVHNELISYKKVNYRISSKCITYKIGRKTLAKMLVRGKTLKLHLALNIDDYSKTIFFQEDSGDVKAYEDVPFTVKIKSGRGKNNAIKLVNSLAENNALVKIEEFKKVNILKELRQYK